MWPQMVWYQVSSILLLLITRWVLEAGQEASASEGSDVSFQVKWRCEEQFWVCSYHSSDTLCHHCRLFTSNSSPQQFPLLVHFIAWLSNCHCRWYITPCFCHWGLVFSPHCHQLYSMYPDLTQASNISSGDKLSLSFTDHSNRCVSISALSSTFFILCFLCESSLWHLYIY